VTEIRGAAKPSNSIVEICRSFSPVLSIVTGSPHPPLLQRSAAGVTRMPSPSDL
jgi:hypothetical protein